MQAAIWGAGEGFFMGDIVKNIVIRMPLNCSGVGARFLRKKHSTHSP
jgi:hypothetical protein